MEDADPSEDGPPTDPVWYKSIKDFIVHVRKVPKDLCKHPDWILSIDEMFRKFKGRSNNTFWTKNQPDKEGYKMFAVYDQQTCYVHDFPMVAWRARRQLILLWIS
jgi:hypothetical protein